MQTVIQLDANQSKQVMTVPILLILVPSRSVVYQSHDNSGYGACLDHSTSAGTADHDHFHSAVMVTEPSNAQTVTHTGADHSKQVMTLPLY
jgi:hypothetical protein